MIIIYESKTGFSERYGVMLAKETGLRAFSTAELRGADASGRRTR